MIPIKLTIEGFLAFRHRTVIDFTKVHEDGLFLISGPTGSGKTSIFDAMVFALYGEGSTSERTSRTVQFRSTLLNDDEDYSVEFIFSIKGRTYTVRRNTVKGKAKVSLFENGKEGSAIVKSREINAEVEHILGLTFEQFRKIVLLPQGEFRNFLTSTSLEKTEILGNLFDTEKISRIKDIIKRKKDDLERGNIKARDIIENEKQISEKAKSLVLNDEIISVLKGEIKGITEELDELKKKRSNSEEQLRLNKIHLDHLEKDNQAIERLKAAEIEEAKVREESGKIEDMREKARMLTDISPVILIFDDTERLRSEDERYRKDLIILKDELAEIEVRAEAVRKEISENPVRKQAVESSRRDLDRLLDKIKESEKLMTLRAEAERSEREAAYLEKILNDLKVRRKEDSILSEELMSLNKAYAELKDRKGELKDRSVLAEKDRQRYEKIFRLSREKSGYVSEKEIILKKIDEASSEHERLKKELSEISGRFELQGLSAYSHLLHEGEKCPLCGSVVESIPEHAGHAEITPEDVERARKRAENVQKQIAGDRVRYEKLEESISKAESELDGLDTDIEEIGNSESLLERTGDLIDELKEKIGKLDQKIRATDDRIRKGEREHKKNLEDLKGFDEAEKNAENKKSELEKLKAAIMSSEERAGTEDVAMMRKKAEDLRDNADRLEKLINDCEKRNLEVTKELQAIRTRIEEKNTQKENNSNRLNERESEFEMNLSETGVEKALFMTLKGESGKLGDMKDQIDAYDKKLIAMTSELRIRKEAAEGKIYTDLEEYKNGIKEQEEKLTVINSEYDEMLKRSESYRRSYDRIKDAADIMDGLSQDLETARKLFILTSKSYSFENYVLGYYLDGVLRRANKRLLDMTMKRYYLVRRTDEKKKMNKTQGLDLDVFDSYSNSQRDVRSLSGGEGFKASLALALGLSDYILEKKAGIRIDSIFIDEGFGTLDQESLDSALEMIRDLRAGGRIVGIISHVEELKERISSRFIVESNGSEGSSVRFFKQ